MSEARTSTSCDELTFAPAPISASVTLSVRLIAIEPTPATSPAADRPTASASSSGDDVAVIATSPTVAPTLEPLISARTVLDMMFAEMPTPAAAPNAPVTPPVDALSVDSSLALTFTLCAVTEPLPRIAASAVFAMTFASSVPATAMPAPIARPSACGA